MIWPFPAWTLTIFILTYRKGERGIILTTCPAIRGRSQSGTESCNSEDDVEISKNLYSELQQLPMR
jgi:hypothetical protein